MLDIKTIALILLIGRAVSVTFILLVLYKQFKLLGLPVDPIFSNREIKNFRKILFTLSCIILIGNFVPIIIDTLTLFVQTQRPAQVHTISILYALSNSFTSAISAFTIWLLYRTALSTDHGPNDDTN